MRLTLRTRTFDLTTRALVVGVGDAAVDGADLVELARPGPAHSVLGYMVAGGPSGVDLALAAGADLVRLSVPSSGDVRRCAAAGVSVVVPDADMALAAEAGMSADRIVPESLLLDVAGLPCPLPAVVAGVLRGARLVRTDDVRAARRVCDVLAAIAGAGG